MRYIELNKDAQLVARLDYAEGWRETHPEDNFTDADLHEFCIDTNDDVIYDKKGEAIMSKWKDGEFLYKAENGVGYDSPKQYFGIEVMGFCGCASDYLIDVTWNIINGLYLAKKNDESWFYDYEGKKEDYTSLQECILFILDSKEIIEHGSSIRGSWLTDKGFAIIDKIIKEQNEIL